MTPAELWPMPLLSMTNREGRRREEGGVTYVCSSLAFFRWSYREKKDFIRQNGLSRLSALENQDAWAALYAFDGIS
jgi:hypothetical protein